MKQKKIKKKKKMIGRYDVLARFFIILTICFLGTPETKSEDKE